jgi:hypothetical protein
VVVGAYSRLAEVLLSALGNDVAAGWRAGGLVSRVASQSMAKDVLTALAESQDSLNDDLLDAPIAGALVCTPSPQSDAERRLGARCRAGALRGGAQGCVRRQGQGRSTTACRRTDG